MWWRWALVSPDGVAPSRMVDVSASVSLPLHHKVQKFSSGTGSPGWSWKKGHKTVVVWCVVLYVCQDAKMILTAPPPKNWKRPPGRLHITWLSTIQHDLTVYNLDLAQNHPLWRLMSTYVWRYALLVVHARKEEEDVGPLLCAFVHCLRQVLKAVHIKCAAEQCRCARIRGLH